MGRHNLQDVLETPNVFTDTSTATGLIDIAGHGKMLGFGDTVPDGSATGWGKGAIFLHTDGSSGDDLVYQNNGTTTAATFIEITSVAGADFGTTGLLADVVAESTPATGVTIDGVLIKDTTIDVNGTADAIIVDADADTTISAPTDDQLDIEVGGADVVTVTNPSAGEHAEFKLQSPTTFNPREMWEFFEDFNMKALDETNEQWILNSGSDDLAVDPAIVTAEEGTVFLDAGDGDGTVAQDGSQVVLAIPVQADSGGLVFEARVKIEDITGCSVNIGLTDVTTLEEPFSGASDTLTSVASNAVCFLFDDGNTTKEWFMAGVDGDTDATGNGATGTAPVNDTYQVLRCEIDADGEGAEFFINGTSVGSLTASVCAASTDLFLTAIIVGDGANSAAVGLTVDYMYVAHTR